MVFACVPPLDRFAFFIKVKAIFLQLYFKIYILVIIQII